MKKTPVLTPEKMTDFLMNRLTMDEYQQNEYRKRSIAFLRDLHGDAYANKVYKLCAAIYKERRKGKRGQK